MIRCICAFSASSFFRRAKSLVSRPAYFSFQRRIVFAWMPCRRPSSVAGVPANDLSLAEAGLLHGEVSLGPRPEISQFQLVQICPVRSPRQSRGKLRGLLRQVYQFDNCQIDILGAPRSATQGAQAEYTLGAWTERLALSWKP